MAKIELVCLNPAKNLQYVVRGIFNVKHPQFINAISRRRVVTGFTKRKLMQGIVDFSSKIHAINT
jgi:hypothetical protein